jgi:hypothetical protein
MALAIYREEMRSYPQDLAILLDGDFPGKKRWEGLQQEGLLHNHQSGKMERPIYHGSKDLRERGHDVSKFILLAAPSADPQGKRLVAVLDGSVKSINEADYQKQVQTQVKASTAAENTSGIRVITRTPAEWVINYTSDGERSLSLWSGTSENAGFLWIPKGPVMAKLKATKEGLVLEASAQRLGPMSLEAFSFAEKDAILEQDGSVIIGKCANGVVGIRVAEFPAKNGPERVIALTPDFEQATREFHFKLEQPSLLVRGTARYLVIPVKIKSHDYGIKRVNWESEWMNRNSKEQNIDLSLVLESSGKGTPRTDHTIMVGTVMDRKCNIRYLNRDGTFVDLMTVDTGKLEAISVKVPVPHEEAVLAVVPWRSKRDLDLLISLADKEKTLDGLTALVREIASWGERDPKAIHYLEALRISGRRPYALTGRDPKDILKDVISFSIKCAENNARLEKEWSAAEHAMRATRFDDNDSYKALIEGRGWVVESDKFPLVKNGFEFQWSVVSITKNSLILERLTVRPIVKTVPTPEKDGKDIQPTCK